RCKAKQGPVDVTRRGAGYAARADRATGGLERWSPRQNPAYRPATEKAPGTGLFPWLRFAGDREARPPRARSRRLSSRPRAEGHATAMSFRRGRGPKGKTTKGGSALSPETGTGVP